MDGTDNDLAFATTIDDAGVIAGQAYQDSPVYEWTNSNPLARKVSDITNRPDVVVPELSAMWRGTHFVGRG